MKLDVCELIHVVADSDQSRVSVKTVMSVTYSYTPQHEDVWRDGSNAPRILNCGTRCDVSGQLHASAALPTGGGSTGTR
jgi:hypothetical protein